LEDVEIAGMALAKPYQLMKRGAQRSCMGILGDGNRNLTPALKGKKISAIRKGEKTPALHFILPACAYWMGIFIFLAYALAFF